MKEVQIRLNNDGGYSFGASLTGHTVTAFVDEYGVYYVNSKELLRIGCDENFVYTDSDWAFTEDEITVIAKRFSRTELLDHLDMKSQLSKRIRRMIKWGKRK